MNGEVKGSVGNTVIAALTAETETVEELPLVPASFVQPQDKEDWLFVYSIPEYESTGK